MAPGKLMPWRGLASSPGPSRSGSVPNQNCIADETGAPSLSLWFSFFPPAAARSVNPLPASRRLWVPQVRHIADPSLTLPVSAHHQVFFLLKPVPLSCALLPAIICSRPGAAWPAEVAHSLTASNTIHRSTRCTATCWPIMAPSPCRAAFKIRIERARWNQASAMRRKRR